MNPVWPWISFGDRWLMTYWAYGLQFWWAFPVLVLTVAYVLLGCVPPTTYPLAQRHVVFLATWQLYRALVARSSLAKWEIRTTQDSIVHFGLSETVSDVNSLKKIHQVIDSIHMESHLGVWSSELLPIPYFDPVRTLVMDPMHRLLGYSKTS